jgi:hypothetical protein
MQLFHHTNFGEFLLEPLEDGSYSLEVSLGVALGVKEKLSNAAISSYELWRISPGAFGRRKLFTRSLSKNISTVELHLQSQETGK